MNAPIIIGQPNEIAHDNRLKVLDGWRALSILMVLAGHWLPLGPKSLNLNAPVAAGGMAIFFTLSGFLITRFLLERPQPVPFLIRRLLRILPLAWAAMLILFFVTSGPLLPNLLFTANLSPAQLFHGGEHLWSLCVEMQFYVGIALLVAVAGRRGLYLLPLIAVTVTVGRIVAGETISIITWFRMDEILAGAILALLYTHRVKLRLNFYVAAIIAAACVYNLSGPLAYARPYAVALMVGVTLWSAPAWLRKALESKVAKHIADISYALYVFHGMLSVTWLGVGDILAKYAKRPLLMAVTWGLAYLSTRYYEKRFIEIGRRVTKRRSLMTQAAEPAGTQSPQS